MFANAVHVGVSKAALLALVVFLCSVRTHALLPTVSREDGPRVYTLLLYKAQITEGVTTFQLKPRDFPAPPPKPDGTPTPHNVFAFYPQDDIRPIVSFSTKDGVIQHVEARFDERDILPPFEFTIFDAVDTSKVIVPRNTWEVRANVSMVIVSAEKNYSQVSALPEQFYAEMAVHPMRVTSYIYELDGLSDELWGGDMFDLVPRNASMLFKFLVRINETEDELGVWVQRKPPMPDFVLMVAVDGLVVASHTMSYVPAGGLGLASAVEDIKQKNHSKFSFIAHFFERPRTQKAVAVIDNVDLLVQRIQEEDRRFEVYNTNVPHASFKLQYYNDTNHVALKMLQPGDIEMLQVTIYDDAGAIVFREEEDHVPYYGHNADRQMGWYYALPAIPKENATETLQLLRRVRKFEAVFNYRGNLHPVELMKRWIEDFGGEVAQVGVANEVIEEYSRFPHGSVPQSLMLRDRGLVAKQDIAEGATAIALPYRVLLTAAIVESNEWCNLVRERAGDFAQYLKERNIHEDEVQFMLFTFFSLMQPSHAVDGTNWRLYFDTFPRHYPPIPAFYNDDELAMFSFAPSVQREAERMRTLYKVEYETLRNTTEWFESHFSEEEYLLARATIETRVMNVSGTLLLLPLLDFMRHDDAPAVSPNYNDEEQLLFFNALRKISEGEPITVDYGVTTRTKKEFLLQFGFVPPGAQDSVDIEYNGTVFVLTADKSSRDELVDLIARHVAEESDDNLTVSDDNSSAAGADEQEKVGERFGSLLQTKMEQLPQSPHWRGIVREERPMHDPQQSELAQRSAQRLLDSERYVLDLHLKWLTSGA